MDIYEKQQDWKERNVEKPVCINGRFFCQNTMHEVRRVFDDIAKKIIETDKMISIVL